MNKYLLGLALVLLLAVFMYRSRNQVMVKNDNVQVVTSFYPLYFFASEIGGGKADVRNITPAGAEPHDYEPTTQDIVSIEKSKLLILNGSQLEAWGDKVKDNLQNKSVEIISVGDDLASQQIEEEGKKIRDPHVWLSPPLAKKEIENILKGYLKVDPSNKLYYESNTKKLKSQLAELDDSYKQGLKNCIQRNFVTSHAAFGYLAKAYDLKQIPISGLSPEEEPSSKQLIEVSKFAKDNNVKYIFFESLVSPKLSETVANEIGAKTLVLDPIEGISDSDMKSGKNYLSVMNNNLKNLKIALECK
ncbi:High-affinity zinc uptake system binding-protein ZnuA [Candidatus Roizmanbacteria bacterium]|nr:High-affinity zinc uptake system binding-protein ZnuA [Candidatus Roizmanbacteria bacterium]